MTQPSSGIFLSAVLDRPVISPSGRVIGALWDVAMSPGDLLPVVPHLLVRKGGGGGAYPGPTSPCSARHPSLTFPDHQQSTRFRHGTVA